MIRALGRLLPDPIPDFPRQAQLPRFSAQAFAALGFRARVGAMARAWAIQGNAAPFAVSLAYLAKSVWFIWLFHAHVRHFDSPRSDFLRLLLYSTAFEVCGFGCGAGPNSGKLLPPFTSAAHFLLAGSARVSVFVRSTRRFKMEVGLFLLFLGMLFRIVYFPDGLSRVDLTLCLLGVWLVLSTRDQVFFLACRSEVFMSMYLVGFFSGSPAASLAAMQAVQLAIWFWAGVAKHGVWWPYVLPVMTSCNPFLSILPLDLGARVKTSFFADYPRDLSPSRLCRVFAFQGAALEMLFPVLLALGGAWGLVGLAMAVQFHLFIIHQVPMGAPLEWNVFSIVAAFFLFTDGALSLTSADPSHLVGWQPWNLSPAVALYLCAAHLALPLLGNLRPEKVSFLVAHRYYAGNWPITLLLVKRTALYRLDRLVTVARFPHDQLASLYSPQQLEQLEYRVLAGRCLHLTSRAWLELVPLAVRRAKGIADDYSVSEEDMARLVDDYLIVEGELLCGTVLGWSFGDGHLSGERLLAEVQARCAFKRGEAMHLQLESLPLLGGGKAAWALRDAAQKEVVASGAYSAEQLCRIAI